MAEEKRKESTVIEINDGTDTLRVTEKAFRVVYQSRGFKKGPLEVNQEDNQDNDQGKDLTVVEVKALLDEQEIDYDPKAKKDELLTLLDGE